MYSHTPVKTCSTVQPVETVKDAYKVHVRVLVKLVCVHALDPLFLALLFSMFS